MDVVRRAGDILKDYYSRELRVSTKTTDSDLVTQADIEAEAMITNAIRAQFPDHAILAEEQGKIGDSDTVWLVDPLDGTTNFAHKHPVFSVTVALTVSGKLQLGIVYDPLRNEMFAATLDGGATLNSRPISVSGAAQLSKSLVATGFPYDRATNPDNNAKEFAVMMPAVQGVRRLGSAALDMAYVACARVDGYWELHLNPWDFAAGVLLVREAGGVVTDMDGAPWSMGARSVITGNAWIHQAIFDRIGRGQGAHGGSARS